MPPTGLGFEMPHGATTLHLHTFTSAGQAGLFARRIDEVLQLLDLGAPSRAPPTVCEGVASKAGIGSLGACN